MLVLKICCEIWAARRHDPISKLWVYKNDCNATSSSNVSQGLIKCLLSPNLIRKYPRVLSRMHHPQFMSLDDKSS